MPKRKPEHSTRLSGILHEYKVPHVLIILAIIIAKFGAGKNDLLTFVIFIALLYPFLAFRLDGKLPVFYALLLLVIAAISFVKNIGLADQLTTYSFWLLVVGVVCLAVNHVKQ